MFDYQAGEKYKLTLIMVGIAGLMAGMFFSMLLLPTPEPQHRRVRHQASMNDLDGGGRAPAAAQAAQTPGAPPAYNDQYPVNAAMIADPQVALNLIEQWLPCAWDLSAGTASANQEKAIAYMTEDCASAYRQNVWTQDLSAQIEEAGLQSTFKATKVRAGSPQPDGSLVIYVEGEQILNVPEKGSRSRPVKLEYLVKQTNEGLKIAGISESGKGS